MVALTPRQRLNLPVPQLAAAICAGLALLAIAIAPGELIESLVMRSGLPAILPAAAPPLGLTARLGLLFAAACGMAALAWAFRTQIAKHALRLGRDRHAIGFALPAIRRADAHPDAPARAPVRAARDLGEPAATLDRGDAELPIPVDLDTPLLAYEAAGGSASPLPIKRPAPLSPGERIETFELTPTSRVQAGPTPAPSPVPMRDAPITAPETEATIHALLERLERGVERRRRPAPPQLHAAVETLRRAVGA